jgi:hypothetical protein
LHEASYFEVIPRAVRATCAFEQFHVCVRGKQNDEVFQRLIIRASLQALIAIVGRSVRLRERAPSMLSPCPLAGRAPGGLTARSRLSTRLVARSHAAALRQHVSSPPLLLSRRRLRRSATLPCAALGTSQVEFDAIPAAVRERSLVAVESLGGAVTVGDVAGRGGLTVTESEAALRALAADTGATLKVSEKGDLLYVFQPRTMRASLVTKSWRLRFAPALRPPPPAAPMINNITNIMRHF